MARGVGPTTPNLNHADVPLGRAGPSRWPRGVDAWASAPIARSRWPRCVARRQYSRVTAQPGSPCDPGRLIAAEDRLGLSLPARIRVLYSGGDGRYQSDGQWWVVWPIDRVVEENPPAWNQRGLSRSLLAFGDDGTGNPFCVPLDTDEDVVLRWNWIDSDVETREGSFDEFLREWVD